MVTHAEIITLFRDAGVIIDRGHLSRFELYIQHTKKEFDEVVVVVTPDDIIEEFDRYMQRSVIPFETRQLESAVVKPVWRL